MNASKSLAAAVTAAALVGSIGFAYAQSDTSTGQGAAVDTTTQNAPAPSADTGTTPSSSSDMSNSGSTTLDERADRN